MATPGQQEAEKELEALESTLNPTVQLEVGTPVIQPEVAPALQVPSEISQAIQGIGQPSVQLQVGTPEIVPTQGQVQLEVGAPQIVSESPKEFETVEQQTPENQAALRDFAKGGQTQVTDLGQVGGDPSVEVSEQNNLETFQQGLLDGIGASIEGSQPGAVAKLLLEGQIPSQLGVLARTGKSAAEALTSPAAKAAAGVVTQGAADAARAQVGAEPFRPAPAQAFAEAGGIIPQENIFAPGIQQTPGQAGALAQQQLEQRALPQISVGQNKALTEFGASAKETKDAIVRNFNSLTELTAGADTLRDNISQAQAAGQTEQVRVLGDKLKTLQTFADNTKNATADFLADVEKKHSDVSKRRDDAKFFNISRKERMDLQDSLKSELVSESDKETARQKLEAAQKVDTELSTGGKFAAAIGVALSALGAGLAGRDPAAAAASAFNMIQKNLNRKIQGQRESRGAKRLQLADAKDSALEAEKAFGSQKAADLFALEQEIQQFNAQQQKVAAETQQKTVMDRSNLVKNAMDQKLLEVQGQVNKELFNVAQNTFTADVNNRNAESARVSRLLAAQGAQSSAFADAQKRAEDPLRNPIPGTVQLKDSRGNPVVPLRTADSDKKARAKVGQFGSTDKTLAAAIKLRRGINLGTLPGTEADAQAKVLGARLVKQLRQIDATGAQFSKNEEELMKAQLGRNPGAFLQRVLPRFLELRKQLRSEATSELTPFGLALEPGIPKSFLEAAQEGQPQAQRQVQPAQ